MTKNKKTEHAGAKNGGGHWGTRKEAKTVSKKLRRTITKDLIRSESKTPERKRRAKSPYSILERLPAEKPYQIDAINFQAHPLSTKIVLVTYMTERIELDGSILQTIRSSIWKLNGTNWQMCFHQGTKL